MLPTVKRNTNKLNKEETMIVEILRTCENTGVKKGEKYNAMAYKYDPNEKVTLLSRIPDGMEPMCNEYRENVTILEPNK